jgi:nicotinate-nucleotide pyrophosphorylase (carboxylating)
VALAEAVVRAVDPGITVVVKKSDGDRLEVKDVVLELSGPAGSILTAERTALNFLQRLSGIATQTGAYVKAVAGTGTGILDTRKTTPGWRWLEKAAVRAGGGTNHRTGLYDMVMVKDNHLPKAGGLTGLQAGIAALQVAHPGMKVELEADTVEQVRAFLTLRGVSFILLDNMSLEEMRECVGLAQGSGVKLEASGGITLERLPEIAATGVDFISSGALTHSVKALDLSLDFSGTEF